MMSFKALFVTCVVVVVLLSQLPRGDTFLTGHEMSGKVDIGFLSFYC
jgi:hypothetical protein